MEDEEHIKNDLNSVRITTQALAQGNTVQIFRHTCNLVYQHPKLYVMNVQGMDASGVVGLKDEQLNLLKRLGCEEI